jgi:hypothetical protein
LASGVTCWLARAAPAAELGVRPRSHRRHRCSRATRHRYNCREVERRAGPQNTPHRSWQSVAMKGKKRHRELQRVLKQVRKAEFEVILGAILACMRRRVPARSTPPADGESAGRSAQRVRPLERALVACADRLLAYQVPARVGRRLLSGGCSFREVAGKLAFAGWLRVKSPNRSLKPTAAAGLGCQSEPVQGDSGQTPCRERRGMAFVYHSFSSRPGERREIEPWENAGESSCGWRA